MFKEFKEFISKGNVVEMAVGVIIAAAFGDIVKAFTSSFIQPLLGLIGGAEIHGTIPLGQSGQSIDYGAFLTAIVNFLIIAGILFLMIKFFSLADAKSKAQLEKLSKKVASKTKKGKKVEEVVEKEPDTKLCPFCFTEIAYKATRCPHCTSEIKIYSQEEK